MKQRSRKDAEKFIRVEGSIAYVQTRCRTEAVIDACDVPKVQKFLWLLTPMGYVTAYTGKYKNTRLHRLILGAKPGSRIDHVNGDKLDNRRSNLRFCNPTQNQQNSRKRLTHKGRPVQTEYKGVARAGAKSYCARIQVNGEKKYLGCYSTSREAAIAYDLAAVKYFGTYAYTNFPLQRLDKLRGIGDTEGEKFKTGVNEKAVFGNAFHSGIGEVYKQLGAKK